MSPPSCEHLEVAVDGHVARVALSRPEVLNALSVALLDELVTVCRWLDVQPDVRVVVLSGTGRAFTAGADLATLELLLADDGTARAAADAGDRAAAAVEALDPVTVASIHGRCVGGGVVLALACDLRVAAAGTRFSIPEVDLGIPLAWGGVPRLLREVGPGVARDLILTCREVGADEALALGLVSRVVAADRLAAEVSELAESLAAKAALPVRATLDAVAAASGLGAPHGWSDADTLLTAVRDPECREAAVRHLARVRDEPAGGSGDDADG